jgi:glutaredoxin 2
MCGAGWARSSSTHVYFMVAKEKYIQQFKKLYKQKNGNEISDDLALEYFEKLVVLTGTITNHILLKKIIISEKYGRK